MADIISDGMTKVTWMLTCSTTSSPTTAQLNAGVSLENYITPDGLNITVETAAVDTGDIASTQDSEIPGRRKDSITLTFKSQGHSAVPWTTFASRPDGFLVVRRSVATTTAWTAGQVVAVYPCRAGDRQDIAPAPNEVEKFSVGMFVTDVVEDSAVVV